MFVIHVFVFTQFGQLTPLLRSSFLVLPQKLFQGECLIFVGRVGAVPEECEIELNWVDVLVRLGCGETGFEFRCLGLDGCWWCGWSCIAVFVGPFDQLFQLVLKDSDIGWLWIAYWSLWSTIFTFRCSLVCHWQHEWMTRLQEWL